MKIKAGKKELLIKDRMVIRFEGEGEMCKVYLENGRSVILQEGLDDIEDQLQDSSFIRVHMDHLVNVNHISKIPERSEDGIILSNASRVPVSEKSLLYLKEIIENHINP